MAIGWDEGYTLGREARLRDWFRGLRDPVRFAAQWQPPAPRSRAGPGDGQDAAARRAQLDSRSKLLSDRAVLEWFWPFAREEPHGHPPFYALARPGRGRLGPVMARLCRGPGWDRSCSFQPDGRRDFWLRLVRGGAAGRRLSRRVPGSFSQICSATGTTRLTTPF